MGAQGVNMKRKLKLYSHKIWTSKSIVILSLICSLSVASCGVQTKFMGKRNCTINNWEQVKFSFRDVIPGVESNVIRERFYFVEVAVLDDPICEGVWLLEIDDISVPMGMRKKKDGALKWTGTRYYLEHKKTLSKKDSALVTNALFKLNNDETWLILDQGLECRAYALPKPINLGTSFAP